MPRTSHSPGQVAENGALGGLGTARSRFARRFSGGGGGRRSRAGRGRDTVTSPPGRQRKRELGGGEKAVRVVRQERGCGVGLSTRSGKLGAGVQIAQARRPKKLGNEEDDSG